MSIDFEYLSEIKNHCDDLMIDRFHNWEDKIVVVEYDINIQPEKEILAVETIKKIEGESHIPGLTDKIKQFLEERTK